jgi:hypothetical protein
MKGEDRLPTRVTRVITVTRLPARGVSDPGRRCDARRLHAPPSSIIFSVPHLVLWLLSRWARLATVP